MNEVQLQSLMADVVRAALLCVGEAAGSTRSATGWQPLRSLLKRVGQNPDTAIDGAMHTLERSGHVQLSARQVPRLTDIGRAAALEWTGLRELPRPAGWGLLMREILPTRALGQSVGDLRKHKKARATWLCAEVVRQHFELPIGPWSTPKTVRDSVGWHLLARVSQANFVGRSHGAGTPFTAGAILVALACAYLGLRSTPKPEKVLAVLADGVVGAGGLSPASLTDALCERLFKTTSDDRPENVAVSDAVARGSSTVDKPSVLHPATETGSSGSPEPQDLARFAAEAVEAARRTKDGWFGDGMVFVSHAFRSFHNGKGSLSFVEFKDALLRAHRAGHLALAGADMPQALPSEDLEESLIKHGDSKFYFVRV